MPDNGLPRNSLDDQMLRDAHPAKLPRPMAELFISIWRAHARVEQGGDPERALFMVQRHLDAAMQRMGELGVELRSYQGERYDPGMRSVAPTHFQVSGDVSFETIGEVSSPAIFVNGHVASKAQAVVLVPAPEETVSDPEPPKAKPEPKKPRAKTAKRKAPRKKAQPRRKS